MNRRHAPIQDRRSRPRLSLKLHDDLVYFGVPAERHTLEGLRSCFPENFRIEQANLEFDALAEVLVHLLKNGIIQVRP